MQSVPTAVALVTSLAFPDLAPDDRPLLTALEALGLRGVPLVWDDPTVDWSRAGVTVVRSTWDYHHRLVEFLAWAERISPMTSLLNPAELLRWNTHKSYLRDLAGRGVPVVPTAWLPAGGEASLADLLSSRGWSTVVVKPAVSASAHGTMLVPLGSVEAGQAHLSTLLPTCDMMVQPYYSSVESYGERSLIFIDGELMHALRRTPVLTQQPDRQAGPDYRDPAGDEVLLARQVLLAVGQDVLYARVDIVRDETGAPCLMELELVEPMLFLVNAPRAVERFAQAIATRVAAARRTGGSSTQPLKNKGR
ncbi:MAG: hypothetical protein M3014_09275 [Chloroflexota bacterium]|nr:hypothetical protein [Chloroflexota bacterium]